MTNGGTKDIASIRPMFGFGAATFEINSTDSLRVLLRRDGHGWKACSSVSEVFDGGSRVAGPDIDLLQAAKAALALATVPSRLLNLEEEERTARNRAAEVWKHLIARGASGRGMIGTESTGETFIVELAGTLLACGKPALELFDRFSWSELQAIGDAVRIMGPDGWYWRLKRANEAKLKPQSKRRYPSSDHRNRNREQR